MRGHSCWDVTVATPELVAFSGIASTNVLFFEAAFRPIFTVSPERRKIFRTLEKTCHDKCYFILIGKSPRFQPKWSSLIRKPSVEIAQDTYDAGRLNLHCGSGSKVVVGSIVCLKFRQPGCELIGGTGEFGMPWQGGVRICTCEGQRWISGSAHARRISPFSVRVTSRRSRLTATSISTLASAAAAR